MSNYKIDNAIEPIEVKTIETNMENQRLVESPRRIHTFNFPEMVNHQDNLEPMEIENNLLFKYKFAVVCNTFLSCLYSVIMSPFYLIYTFGFILAGMFIGQFKIENRKRIVIFYIGYSLLFMSNIIINGIIIVNNQEETSEQLGFFIGIFVPLFATNVAIFKNPYNYLKFLMERQNV